ncbi:DNRLRE domain-containing protein [Actinoplanes sp. NPDC048967]|uniref:DNRLRE domain-containing protein n=1 Tax=Actinoplanes sp. NPDC048967 TaxID=3155269 RepID=UPI0033F02750
MTGRTTETLRVWALPDGSYRAETHVAPVRTRDSSGRWVDVDLAMQRRSDGSVAPKAHPYGLTLSGKRNADTTGFVTLGASDTRTALGWRGALPEPVLDGRKATYREVRPGVDLVVEAGRSGYEYFVVLNNPQAAAAMATIALPWDDGSMTASSRAVAGAELSMQSASGAGVQVSEALMWDARTAPDTGEPAHVADVDVTIRGNAGGGADMVLTPSAAFLADPGLKYPVTVDPAINVDPKFDAYVQNTITNTDKSGADVLKIGRVVDPAEGCSSECKARSYLSFGGLAELRDSKVDKAELFLWNSHSWSCTAASWEAWRVDYVDETLRWGNQPTWREKDGTSTGTKGYSSGCGDGWVSVSVRNTFQHLLSGTDNRANVGLQATNENTNAGWKKFNSSEASSHTPYVSMIYNRRPNTPTGLKIDSCYSACNSPAVVRSGTPRLWATVSDPDGGTVRAEYEVYNSTKGTQVAKSGTAVTGVSSVSSRPWRVAPFSKQPLPDHTYHWRARACDSYQCGDYSAWFTFVVNTQDPTLPTVTSAQYPPKTTGTWSGGPGQPGTFMFTPNGASEVTEYVYSLNDANPVTAAAGVAGAERLAASQSSMSSLSGITPGGSAVVTRDTSRGHTGGDSLKIVPTATGDATGYHEYAAVAGDAGGGFRLGMRAGGRYRVTGWVYVPAATGLNPTSPGRGLRLAPSYIVSGSVSHVMSPAPTVTDTWVQLSVVMSVPTNATEAYLRVWNGFAAGSGKAVYFDDLSVQELTGTTLGVSLTPTKDSTNVLSVQSRTATGATSDPRMYSFLVNTSDGEWRWGMDDSAGTEATSQPAGHSATFGVGVGWAESGRFDGGVTLDGTGRLATDGPVLNTSAAAGFTVAAWVRLTDLSASRAAVSQQGTNASMFTLGYRNDIDLDVDGVPDPAWCFTVTSADTANAGGTSICTTQYVVPDDYISLIGIYDKPAGKLRLYVQGTADFGGAEPDAVDAPAAWSATNALVIGDSTPTQPWVGDLDHVYAAQRVWDAAKIASHAQA